MDILLRWDQALFHSINQCHIPFFDGLGIMIHEMKEWVWLAVLFLAAWISKRKDRWRILIFTVALMGAIDILNHEFLKDFFARPRPCQALKEIKLLVNCPNSFSFPSTHTMSIFGISVFLSIYYPRWTGLLAALSILIGLSRIYIGVHYPLDVLGGAIIGTLCALLFWQIEKKFLKRNFSSQKKS